MKLLGYCRVSSAGQDKRETIEKQVFDIESYCRGNEFELLEVFKERAVSGTTDFDERPAMIKLLDRLASDDSIDGIVIYHLDRLARNSVVQEMFVLDFERIFVGKKIISVVSGEVTGDDPDRVLFRQIYAAISQYEKSNIARRMKGGKLKKARHGGWNGGVVPYGYRAEDGNLIPYEQESSLIEDIFKMRYTQKKSLKEILENISKRGVKGPTHKRNPDGHWSLSTIHYILNNKIYSGIVTYGGLETPNTSLLITKEGNDRDTKKDTIHMSSGDIALIKMGLKEDGGHNDKATR